MRLESLIRIVQPLRVKGSVGPDIQGITYDSRQVRPGYLFVALKGMHAHGRHYIEDAVGRGAAAVVAEQDFPNHADTTQILVGDARRALAEISCAFYNAPSAGMQVIGVTGTNGKTTTTFMIRAVLQAAGRKPGMIGTVRHEIGERRIPAIRTTPEAPEVQNMLNQMRKAGCSSAVMEVSSHALHQKRVWGVDFDIGVFTNLTPDHLDYHRQMESYFAAKAMLFSGLGQMKKKAAAAINIDDPWGQRLAGICDSRVQEVTFGEHPAAQVRAINIHCDADGGRFDLITPWGKARVHLPLLGRFNIHNALAACSACGALGIDPELMAEVLGGMPPVPGRLERISNERGIHVFVDYAHTMDAMENALKTLRAMARRRVLVVFGCGGDRDRAKRSAMGAVAARLADYTIITSDNPRSEDPASIAADIEQGFGHCVNYEKVIDRTDAIAHAISMAERGDMLLIAGKGHETYQEFGHTVIPFDDREVVRRLI